MATKDKQVHPGSYVVGFYRGTLRHRGWPWFRCIHRHDDSRDASDCAKAAKPGIDAALASADPDAPLPEGWVVYGQETP